MITVDTVAAVAAIVFASAVLQRAVGFGFALFAVPLMAFVVPTKSAVVIVFLNGFVTSAWLATRLRRQIEWSPVRVLGLGCVIGAPVGVVVLGVVSAGTLRLVLGVTTCLAALWIIVSSRWAGQRARGVGRPITFVLGLASGVINTALATSGPPLVYELRRIGLRDDRFRATISAVFVLSNVIGLPLLAGAGLVTRFDLALAATSFVPCLVGIVLGSLISARMEPSHFVWTVDVLLLVTGALTITKAVS